MRAKAALLRDGGAYIGAFLPFGGISDGKKERKEEFTLLYYSTVLKFPKRKEEWHKGRKGPRSPRAARRATAVPLSEHAATAALPSKRAAT